MIVLTSTFAQQKIYDIMGDTFGYELLYRDDPGSDRAICTDGDVATASVVSNALLAEVYSNSYKLFINYTGFLLDTSIPSLLNPMITVIEVLEDVVDEESVLRAIEELSIKGYTIALDDYTSTDYNQKLFSISHLVKLDFRLLDKDRLLDIAHVCRKAGKTMLAEKIETEDEFIFAKNIGCTLFQGYYFNKPMIISQDVIKPHAMSLLALFSTIFSSSPDIKRVTEIIKYDIGIQVRLLRLTISLQLKHGISSIEDLVDELGIERIRDWAYLLGIAYLGTAYHEDCLDTAIVRALFCSKLAQACPDNTLVPEKAFLMGSLSVLKYDEKASAIFNPYVNVDEEVLKAIQHHEGILGSILDITLHCEAGDFLIAERLAIEIGIDNLDIKAQYRECSKQELIRVQKI